MEGTSRPLVFLNSAEETAYDRAQRERQESSTHGDILPLERENDGSIGFAVPQFIRDMWNSITLPRDVTKGYNPTEKDIGQFALDVGVGGVAASAATPSASGTGMFLGKNAMNANIKKYHTAKVMSSFGIDRKEIWNRTGWWQKPDGKWSYEISDEGLNFRPLVEDDLHFADDSVTSVRHAVKHPTLFNEYEANKNAVSMLRKEHSNQVFSGEYDPQIEVQRGPFSGSYIRGGPHGREVYQVSGEDANQRRSVLAHELQHGVQEREGFERGTNPQYVSWWKKELIQSMPSEVKDYFTVKSGIEELERMRDTLLKTYQAVSNNPKGWDVIDGEEVNLYDLSQDIKEVEEALVRFSDMEKGFSGLIGPYKDQTDAVYKLLKLSDHEAYKRNEGESIARLTQKRLDYTDAQRRAIPPWEDFDVPEEEIWTEAGVTKNVESVTNLNSPVLEHGPSSMVDAYHGSPHDFDRFDITKIGTGEGAQVYGHGLYFADNPQIADYYRKTLAKKSPVKIKDKEGNVLFEVKKADDDLGGFDVTSLSDDQLEIFKTLDDVRKYEQIGKNIDDLINQTTHQIETLNTTIKNDYFDKSGLRWNEDSVSFALEDKTDFLRRLQRVKDEGYTLEKSKGRNYSVEIDAEPEEFLHWDEPLSKQSDFVKERLQGYIPTTQEITNLMAHVERNRDVPLEVIKDKLIDDIKSETSLVAKLKGHLFVNWLDHVSVIGGDFDVTPSLEFGELTGKDVVMALEELGEYAPKKASDLLNALGIKGTRYFNAASRDGKKQEYNYVIFDDKIVRIKEKK